MYHALLQPKTHDAMIWFSIILPASTIQRWAFRADPAMGYHGRYHEISLDVNALIWNDLNRKRMRWVEHLEPWLQSLHFCSNNHSPKIYIEIWQNVVSAQVYWYLLDHPKCPFSIHSYWESELQSCPLSETFHNKAVNFMSCPVLAVEALAAPALIDPSGSSKVSQSFSDKAQRCLQNGLIRICQYYGDDMPMIWRWCRNGLAPCPKQSQSFTWILPCLQCLAGNSLAGVGRCCDLEAVGLYNDTIGL